MILCLKLDMVGELSIMSLNKMRRNLFLLGVITPTTLGTGLMVQSKDRGKPIIGIEPLSQDDHVSMMTDPFD